MASTSPNKNSISSSPRKTKATLLTLPEELMEECINLLPDPNNIFEFAQVAGSMPLYRITLYAVLRTNPKTRKSALHWACANGDVDLLRTALKLGAGVNMPVPPSTSHSHYTCGYSCESHIYPQTPLLVAIAHQQVAIAEVLLREYGADSNMRASGAGWRSSLKWTGFRWHSLAWARELWWAKGAIPQSGKHPLHTALEANIDDEKRVSLIALLLDWAANLGCFAAKPRVRKTSNSSLYISYTGFDRKVSVSSCYREPVHVCCSQRYYWSRPITLALRNDCIPATLTKRIIESSSASTETTYSVADWYQQYIHRHRISIGNHDEDFVNQARVLTDIRHRFSQDESFTTIEMDKIRHLRDLAIARNNKNDERFYDWSCVDFLRHALRIPVGELGMEKHKQLLEFTLTQPCPISELDASSGQSLWVMAVDKLAGSGYHRQPSLVEGYYDKVICLLRVMLDAGVDPTQESDCTKGAALGYIWNGRKPTIKQSWTWTRETALSCLCDPRHDSRHDSGSQVGKLMDFLVREHTPVNVQGKYGLTALHFASKYTLAYHVKRLVEYGADVNTVDTRGFTALHCACRIDTPLNRGDECSSTLQWQSRVQDDRLDVVRILLCNGADPSIADKDGFTPLHYASKYGFLDVVKLLLADTRVKVDVKSRNLRTPLHCLDWRNDSDYDLYDLKLKSWPRPRIAEREAIARLLINSGADAWATDKNRKLPIELVRWSGLHGIADILDNSMDVMEK
ncbi:ankyrin repeat-containing domain protein [Hypomontagnella submonticulosa]|nr:ankyrin repeat-containing domain protein [Hypomontagnella submonticulosa]